MLQPVRILIANDSIILREGIRALLEGLGDVVIVGEADNVIEMMQQTRIRKPDIILLDLRRQAMPSPVIMSNIKLRYPGIHILMTRYFADDDRWLATMMLAAMGYTLRNTPIEALIRAIRELALTRVKALEDNGSTMGALKNAAGDAFWVCRDAVQVVVA